MHDTASSMARCCITTKVRSRCNQSREVPLYLRVQPSRNTRSANLVATSVSPSPHRINGMGYFLNAQHLVTTRAGSRGCVKQPAVGKREALEFFPIRLMRLHLLCHQMLE